MSRRASAVIVLSVIFAPALAVATAQQAQSQGQTGASVPSQAIERIPAQAEEAPDTNGGVLPEQAVTLPLDADEAGLGTAPVSALREGMPSYIPRNERARERMSAVASAAEELIFVLGQLEGGIGDQISAIAREHVRDHEQASEALDEAEGRSSFARFFIGPNYSRLKEAKQTVEQNRSRIQQIRQQINLATNDEITKIRLIEELSQMEMQDLALGEQIGSFEGGFSLFGWLSRMISKYES